MSRIRRLFASVFLSFGVLLAGCADSPTAPEQPLEVPEASEGLLGLPLLGGGGSVDVLERSEPLAQAEVATAVIGRRGGTIRLPESGLVFRVPRWALRRPTEITITAPAGDLMGYHFEPHGLEFRRPAIVVQDLTATELGLLGRLTANPVAAYFQGPLQPTVDALEILDLNILGIFGKAVFRVDHFSGYVIATD